MIYLKQNTATAILIGPFIDDSDGKTPETGLDVTTMDCDLYQHSDSHPLTKSDLTLTASGGDNDCSHVANGFYSLELTGDDVDTLGKSIISVNISGALPVWHEFMVLPANVFDSLFSSDRLQVDVRELGDSNLALTTQMKADVNTEADQALSDYDPPTKAELDTAESNIRGADSDTLETLSDQLDTAQADLDNPGQYKADVSGLSTFDPSTDEVDIGKVKGVSVTGVNDFKADVSGLAVEANVEGHVTNSLNSYDPPTRAEATSDKNEVIAETNANETKIDAIGSITTAIQAKTNNLPADPAGVSDIPTVEEIDAKLATEHGSGSWEETGATAPTVEEIDAKLATEHGSGSWEGSGSGSGSSNPYIVHIDIQITEYDEYTEEVKIYTKTQPELNFVVTKDGDPVTLTGETIYLIVKKDEKTPIANALINKAGTVHDINQVRFNLTLEETTAFVNKEGTYKGQLDIGPDETVTPKFNVIIERKLRQ